MDVINLLRINDFDIEISKGDAAEITFCFVEYDLDAGCTATMALRRTPNGSSIIWEKQIDIVDDKATFALTNEDTGITSGTYFWDLRVIFPNENTFTPIEPHVFKILEVVGSGRRSV